MKTRNKTLAAALAFAALSCTAGAGIGSDGCRCPDGSDISGLAPICKVLEEKVGAELSCILLEADSIKVTAEPLEGECPKERNVTGFHALLMKYLLCQPTMYASDVDVYGLFSPFVTAAFCKGGQTVYAVFDYGLGKWQIRDSGDKVLMQHDLPQGALLSLFYVLCEDSQLMRMTYDDYCKGK